MAPKAILAPAALAALVLTSAGAADAHLFHFANVQSRETQVARDFRLIKELTQWGTKDFLLAAQVYRGELRPREQKPSEPGYLLKADYQRRPTSPPLKALVQAMDRRRGTSVDAEIEAALARRDEAGLEAAFRTFFHAQVQDLLEVLDQRLAEPQPAATLFAVLADYLFTSYEVFLALNHPRVHTQVQDALAHLRDALPRAAPPKPADPAGFARSRHRLESLLASVALRAAPR